MTFSIVARCPTTGRFGVAITSRSLGVGAWCDGGVRSHVGVCLTQGHFYPGNNHLGIRLLAQGFAPGHVLSDVLANDAHHIRRQVVVIGADGVGAAYTGTRCAEWSGHLIKPGLVISGDALPHGDLLETIALAYESHAALPFDERLLKSLEAGADEVRPTTSERPRARSAALIVYGSSPYSDFDLRVDAHDDAVAELRRAFDEFKPYEAYYVDRGKNPHGAIPQREFADILTGNRQLKDVL